MRPLVNLQAPVNWSSPLNRGRVSWLLRLPGQTRGGMVRDLCRRNNGTLTGGAYIIGSKGLKGGYESTFHDGTDDYVQVGVPTNLDFGSGDFTISAWAYVTTGGTNKIVISRDKDNTPHTLLFKDFNDNIRLDMRDSAGNSAVAISSNTLSTNTWYHVLGTRIGTTGYCYVNGIQKGSATNASLGTPYEATADWRVGTRHAASLLPWAGNIAGPSWWNRGFTETEVAALYKEEATGYPTTLNYLTSRFWGEQAAAPGGTTSPWYYYRQMQAMAG